MPVKTRIKPTEVPPTHDAWGIPIQPHAVEAFAVVPLFDVLIAHVRQARAHAEELMQTPGGVLLARAQSDPRRGVPIFDLFDHTIQALDESKPTLTVCPMGFLDRPHGADCPVCMGVNWTGYDGIACAAPGWRNARLQEAPDAAKGARRMKAAFNIPA